MRMSAPPSASPPTSSTTQRNRTNYDYIFGVHGDFLKERIFYTLGGDVMHYQLIGNGITPHAGLSFYALRPRHGVFSGTRLNCQLLARHPRTQADR